MRRALDSFGDAEVHVVLSARDLVRQIPAEWQENVKHRRTVGYREFLDRITDPARPGELASWFWGVQEVPDILDRWGGTLPPRAGAPGHGPQARGRRATCSGSGSPACSASTGVDLELETDRANPSLGVPETALVRRINKRVNDGVLAGEDYRQFVRELLAHRTLSRRTGSPRLGLPDDVRAWAVDLSESWIEELAGPRVRRRRARSTSCGPTTSPTPFVDPDHPDEAAVAEAAIESIVTLLEEAARLQDVEHSCAATSPQPSRSWTARAACGSG